MPLIKYKIRANTILLTLDIDFFSFNSLEFYILKNINDYNIIKAKLKSFITVETIFDENFEPFYAYSSIHFRHNKRYFGLLNIDDDYYLYLPGRKLEVVESTKLKTLKKKIIKFDEMMDKVIYGGVYTYSEKNGSYAIHMLHFNPLYVYFYKQIFKHVKFFLHMEETSYRAVMFTFKQQQFKFKKKASIKKNLLKKYQKQLKKNQYTLISL